MFIHNLNSIRYFRSFVLKQNRTMSCCPPNAEKYLAPDYTAVGTIHTLPCGTEFYATGSQSSKLGIFLIPDIFGWNGGRTRNIADYFAEQGYYVTVPKLLTPGIDGGTDNDGFKVLDFSTFFRDLLTFPLDTVLMPRSTAVINHMKSVGVEKLGVVGFCWGGWLACHILKSPLHEHFTSCAIGHPSVHLEALCYGGDNQKLIDQVLKPVLLLPCKGDPDEYRENGAWYKSLKERHPTSETYDFVDFDHGFIPRGDISKPEVKEAVDLAMSKMSNFFKAHF